jgi:GNAT superfamily N-acetyltransferase
MRSQRVPMTREEFDRLPFELGWKHEYLDGHLHRSPRHVTAVAKLHLGPRPVTAALRLRPVTAADREPLIAGYVDAFSDTIHFCDYAPERIAQGAHEDIDHYFSGRRGRPLPASRVAVTASGGRLVGAALIAEDHREGAFLRLLFVVPAWQGHGIATAMVSDAINELYASGTRLLRSQYHPGNESSRRWHRTLGFVDEPDVLLFQLYFRRAAHELWRRERLGALGADERRRLRVERDRWKRRLHTLEAGTTS